MYLYIYVHTRRERERQIYMYIYGCALCVPPAAPNGIPEKNTGVLSLRRLCLSPEKRREWEGEGDYAPKLKTRVGWPELSPVSNRGGYRVYGSLGVGFRDYGVYGSLGLDFRDYRV